MSTLSTYGRASLVGLATAVVAACGAAVPQSQSPASRAAHTSGSSASQGATGNGTSSSTSQPGSSAPTSSLGLPATGSGPGGLTIVNPGHLGSGVFGAPFPEGFPIGSASGHMTQGSCPANLVPGWLAKENRLSGTNAWLDARRTKGGTINGYLSQTSAGCGDTVTVYLTSSAAVTDATVIAYRMGYYGGAGGREVWRSDNIAVTPQPVPTVTDGTLETEAANWQPSLRIPVTGKWTPGYYMLVVRAAGQTASSMPLVVRADGDTAPLAYQASVLTYQAYNTYGGFSAYQKSVTDARSAKVVSFNRPYDDGGYYSPYQYELPLIREIEKLGIDTDYLTDIDVDADPQELLAHKGVITGGHSEYWTKRMYDGVEAARDAGVNVAFFGANAIYTAARLEPDGAATPARQVAIYRSRDGDPGAAADPSQSTVNWADEPLNRPEAAMVGEAYGYVGAVGGLRVLHANSWIFAGTNVSVGQVLSNTVGGEFDQVDPSRAATPKDIDVLAAMPIRTKGGTAKMASTTYYVAASQAGVFDSGTTYWPCAITGDCLHMHDSPASRAIIGRFTDNILTAFAAGPAGLEHPSTPNLPPSPEGLVSSAATATDVAQLPY